MVNVRNSWKDSSIISIYILHGSVELYCKTGSLFKCYLSFYARKIILFTFIHAQRQLDILSEKMV